MIYQIQNKVLPHSASCTKLKTIYILFLASKLEEPSPMILQFLKSEIKKKLVLKKVFSPNGFFYSLVFYIQELQNVWSNCLFSKVVLMSFNSEDLLALVTQKRKKSRLRWCFCSLGNFSSYLVNYSNSSNSFNELDCTLSDLI